MSQYNQVLKGATAGQLANASAQVAQASADPDAQKKGSDPDAVTAAVAQVEQAQAALDELLAGASAKNLTTAENPAPTP